MGKGYKKRTLEHCLEDEDFQKVYIERFGNLDGFREALENTIEYCFSSEFNPFLDKPYKDVYWLKFKDMKQYINLDNIWECFFHEINES